MEIEVEIEEREGNVSCLFLAFGHITLAVREKQGLLGFLKVYLLLRCQTVCSVILLGDLPWLTHVEGNALNISTKHVVVKASVRTTRPYKNLPGTGWGDQVCMWKSEGDMNLALHYFDFI